MKGVGGVGAESWCKRTDGGPPFSVVMSTFFTLPPPVPRARTAGWVVSFCHCKLTAMEVGALVIVL